MEKCKDDEDLTKVQKAAETRRREARTDSFEGT